MTAALTRRRLARRAGAWLVIASVSAWVIATQLTITVDLAYFLPVPATVPERVLMQRLGQGPGSQLMFIRLSSTRDVDADAASDAFRAGLERSNLFTRVSNGRFDYALVNIPPPVFRNRYLLRDVDTSVAGLRAALQVRLADMALVSDADALALFAVDPYLASIEVLQALTGPGIDDRRWISTDRRSAFLVAKTRAPAFDTGAQQQAVTAVNTLARELNITVELHGVGVYGAELQHTIQSEATARSLLASVAIALVLLLAYRSWRVLLIAGLPLALGGLIGLAAVAMLFGTMHGITLAFGFTLFGVAIDYPLHVFSHMRNDPDGQRVGSIWPTLRLGVFSTVIAYLAIAGAGSTGLAQLGLFSAVGLLVAWAVARTLLLDIVRTFARVAAPRSADTRMPSRLRHLPWIVALVAGVALALLQAGSIWSNDLSSLTPVAPEKLARDRQLRQQLGAPDIRQVLVVQGSTKEQVLERTEDLDSVLASLAERGVLTHSRAVTVLLPSRRTQAARQARIDVPDWTSRLAAAVDGTPLRANAFDAFVNDVSALAAAPRYVTPNDYTGSVIEDLVAGNLYEDGHQWVSVITLTGLLDPDALVAALRPEFSQVLLVDLKVASATLVDNYRTRALAMLGVACLLIAALLGWRLGVGQRALWILGTLAAAVILTTAITGLALGALSLFNLIATVLIAGLGLDYCLFLSRTESDAGAHRNTRHAVLVCAMSTFAAFAVLAMSAVPVLHSIGLTVALGVALCFGLARLGLHGTQTG